MPSPSGSDGWTHLWTQLWTHLPVCRKRTPWKDLGTGLHRAWSPSHNEATVAGAVAKKGRGQRGREEPGHRPRHRPREDRGLSRCRAKSRWSVQGAARQVCSA